MQNSFQTIQVLRGVAATLVAFFHILPGIENEGFSWPAGSFLFSRGDVGLDIFFVISGFIIYYTSFSRTPPTFSVFLANRFWRLMPPYWLVTTAMIAMGLAMYVVFGDEKWLYSWSALVGSFLLWPMPPESYVLIAAWTLSLEIVFYAVFAIFALRFGPRSFFFAMFLWYLLGIFSLVYTGDMSGWGVAALNPIILEFVLGALIARRLIDGGTSYHKSAFGLGALLLMITMIVDPEFHPWARKEFVVGLPAALLVYGAVGLKLRWPRPFLIWGQSSYILYLLHFPAYLVLARATEELTGYNVYSHPVTVAGMVFAVIAVSFILTIYVEAPYQAYYKRRSARKGKSAAAGLQDTEAVMIDASELKVRQRVSGLSVKRWNADR